jgi:redox-sensitive bicupin YhaK (pirin superfamily)
MAMAIRKASERGRTEIDWLDSRHTFSFGDYHDPNAMGFRVMRVLNDDRVVPGAGFPTHAHRDMEIVTYVLDGGLEHKDSLGTGSVIRAGDVQRMSAGTGIRHSEFNASKVEPVRFLQIWILPERAGLKPSYEQKTFPRRESHGLFKLVAARDGRDGAVSLNQDTDLHVAVLDEGAEARHQLRPGRFAWIQVARGQVTVNGEALEEGDGAALAEVDAVTVASRAPDSEVLLFDMP